MFQFCDVFIDAVPIAKYVYRRTRDGNIMDVVLVTAVMLCHKICALVLGKLDYARKSERWPTVIN
jgi:hypothetical protein